eukprot:2757961-Prymnesium_polylepis.1
MAARRSASTRARARSRTRRRRARRTRRTRSRTRRRSGSGATRRAERYLQGWDCWRFARLLDGRRVRFAGVRATRHVETGGMERYRLWDVAVMSVGG